MYVITFINNSFDVDIRQKEGKESDRSNRSSLTFIIAFPESMFFLDNRLIRAVVTCFVLCLRISILPFSLEFFRLLFDAPHSP